MPCKPRMTPPAKSAAPTTTPDKTPAKLIAPALDESQSAILKALKASKTPLAGKELAEKLGLESAAVTTALKKLRALGLVESPARCLYVAVKAVH